MGDTGNAESVKNGESVFQGIGRHPDALASSNVQNQGNFRPERARLIRVLYQRVKGGAVTREPFARKHVCRGAQSVGPDLQHGVAGAASALQKLQRNLLGYPPDRVDRRDGSQGLRNRLQSRKIFMLRNPFRIGKNQKMQPALGLSQPTG